jgi:hypothetical protein
MTDRIPLDDMTSDQLDALYDQLDEARDGERELGTSVTYWVTLATRHQLWGQRRWTAWKSARVRARNADATLTRVRALRDDLRGITGARYIADMLDNILNSAADERPGVYARMVNRPLSDSTVAAIRARLESGTTPTRRVRCRPPVPCPACARAGQAGLAPTELHPECRNQEQH